MKKPEQLRLDRWQQQYEMTNPRTTLDALARAGLPVEVAAALSPDDEMLPCPELHKLLLRGERCPRCDHEKGGR